MILKSDLQGFFFVCLKSHLTKCVRQDSCNETLWSYISRFFPSWYTFPLSQMFPKQITDQVSWLVGRGRGRKRRRKLQSGFIWLLSTGFSCHPWRPARFERTATHHVHIAIKTLSCLKSDIPVTFRGVNAGCVWAKTHKPSLWVTNKQSQDDYTSHFIYSFTVKTCCLLLKMWKIQFLTYLTPYFLCSYLHYVLFYILCFSSLCPVMFVQWLDFPSSIILSNLIWKPWKIFSACCWNQFIYVKDCFRRVR